MRGQTAPILERIRGLDSRSRALVAAVLSPLFLGAAPIFGKLATNSGADPLMVAAVRTIIAVALLWFVYALFWRKYVYIFAAGLLGCMMVGLVNGIGSIFYYAGLARLDASVAQLLNGTYLIFVVILSHIGGTRTSLRTKLRIGLAFGAVVLLTAPEAASIDWLGVGFMIGNAIMFAGHVVMGQRVLYEMPPQTFTLYVLTTMATVVSVARLVIIPFDMPLVVPTSASMAAIIGLAITTAISRLLMFMGVKSLGSLQTILLGIAEVAVALGAAFVFLGERLAPVQWAGALLMVASMSLVRTREEVPDGADAKAMALPNLAGMRRFVRSLSINASPVSGIPEEELAQIRQIMGPSAASFFENLPPDVDRDELMAAVSASIGSDVQLGQYRLGPEIEDDLIRVSPDAPGGEVR